MRVCTYLCHPLFGDRLCPYCKDKIPSSQNFFDHLCNEHLEYHKYNQNTSKTLEEGGQGVLDMATVISQYHHNCMPTIAHICKLPLLFINFWQSRFATLNFWSHTLYIRANLVHRFLVHLLTEQKQGDKRNRQKLNETVTLYIGGAEWELSLSRFSRRPVQRVIHSWYVTGGNGGFLAGLLLILCVCMYNHLRYPMGPGVTVIRYPRYVIAGETIPPWYQTTIRLEKSSRCFGTPLDLVPWYSV